MELTFLHPYYGLLLLALPVIWLFGRTSTGHLHRTIRAAVFAAVIVALMQPVLMSSSAQEHHVIIVDQSASLSAQARDKAASLAAELNGTVAEQDMVTLIQLGGESTLAIGDEQIVLSGDGASESSLSDALSQAVQAIPMGINSSVTLLSDGLSTDRHWGKALSQLKARQIPVHSYRQSLASGDIYPANITLAPAVVGEKVAATVDVIGSGDNLVVVLSSEDKELARSAPFSSDGRRSVTLEFTPSSDGFMAVSADVVATQAQDSNPDNNRVRTVAAVQPPLKVLYLGDRMTNAGPQLQTLLGEGFKVEEKIASTLPADFDFTQYDLVMQDDLPASRIAASVQENLANAVKNHGVGLVHSGGEAAFGSGGYMDTAIGGLLPVELQQKDDKNDPSVGLAIIIDTSGSMAGTRIELAKQMARIAVRRLQPHDRIGIVEFYGAKHWAIPMQPASNKIEIDRAIGRMKAIGGTVLFPALQEAYYGLKNINTRFKHILMITDAGVEDAGYEAMLRRMAKDRINVTTILVGQGGHNQIMSDMANWGKGRFYSVGNEFQLVEMILKQPSTKKMPPYKQGEFALESMGGEGWWGDVDKNAVPALNGYVQVGKRPGAEVLLAEKNARHPVLASWQYGLGRVTALMTEPVGAGTQTWQGWQEYGQWLGRILAKTAADNNDFNVDVVRQNDSLLISAQRLSTDASLMPEVTAQDWDGQRVDLAINFEEKAPGLFIAKSYYPAEQDLLMTLTGKEGKSQRFANASFSDIAHETQVDPASAMGLEMLSDLTGGESLTGMDLSNWDLQAASGEAAFIVTKLWPYLLLLALLLYLTELLYRRWPSRRIAGK